MARILKMPLYRVNKTPNNPFTSIFNETFLTYVI